MAAFLARSTRSFRIGTSSIATTATRGSMGRSRSLANAAAMSYLSSTRGGGVTSATNWCGARRTLQSSCPTLSSTVEATTESATGTSIEHPSFEIVSNIASSMDSNGEKTSVELQDSPKTHYFDLRTSKPAIFYYLE